MGMGHIIHALCVCATRQCSLNIYNLTKIAEIRLKIWKDLSKKAFYRQDGRVVCFNKTIVGTK